MLTVKDVREAIKDLPDEADIDVEWKDGPPSDGEPGVAVFGFRNSGGEEPALKISVGLFYLNEDE